MHAFSYLVNLAHIPTNKPTNKQPNNNKSTKHTRHTLHTYIHIHINCCLVPEDCNVLVDDTDSRSDMLIEKVLDLLSGMMKTTCCIGLEVLQQRSIGIRVGHGQIDIQIHLFNGMYKSIYIAMKYIYIYIQPTS